MLLAGPKEVSFMLAFLAHYALQRE